MKSLFTKTTSLKLISLCVAVVLILAPLNPFIEVKRAEAQWAVFDGANFGVNSITASMTTAVAGVQSSLALKEWTLDGVAFMLINMLLHEISQSMISWINSGFQGSPSFVTDLGGFLTNVADKAAGQFIWKSGLNFLCSPFKLDVKMALDIQYRRGRDLKVQCTLSNVVNNVNNFANSANAVTNWNQWYQVALRPENNSYGALLLAQESLGVSITNAKGQQIKLLDFGKGFFSKTTCEKVEGIEKCSVNTPGTAIEAQLNNTLDSAQRRIQVADEINEIIAVLFAQLAHQAFAGAAGLLGLTSSGYNGGSGTYYDQMRSSTGSTGYKTTSNVISDSISAEQGWRTANQEVVDLISDTDEFLQNSCRAGDTLSASLRTADTNARQKISQANTTIEKLTDLELMYAGAQGTPDMAVTTAAVMDDYMALQSSGLLHTSADAQIFRLTTLKQVQEEVAKFQAWVTNSCIDNTGAGA